MSLWQDMVRHAARKLENLLALPQLTAGGQKSIQFKCSLRYPLRLYLIRVAGQSLPLQKNNTGGAIVAVEAGEDKDLGEEEEISTRSSVSFSR